MFPSMENFFNAIKISGTTGGRIKGVCLYLFQ